MPTRGPFTEQDFIDNPGVPRVGDTIYVGTRLYLGHGVDDFHGGRATVSSVEYGVSGGSLMPFVSVSESPGMSHNWTYLGPEQKKLKRQFKGQRARPDPDYREQFNRWE